MKLTEPEEELVFGNDDSSAAGEHYHYINDDG